MTCALLSREPNLSRQLLCGGLGSSTGSLTGAASLAAVVLLVCDVLSSGGVDLYSMGRNYINIIFKF